MVQQTYMEDQKYLEPEIWSLIFVSIVYYVCKLCKAVRHKVIHCSSVYNTENLTGISGYWDKYIRVW